MILTDLGVIVSVSDGKGLVFLKKPIQCKVCDRAVMIIINEDGSTRCTSCPDPKETPQ